MAVSATISKVQGKIKLNNGTDPESGIVQTVSQSLPTLATTATDEQIYTVVEAVAPLLSKAVYSVQAIRTTDLTEA